MSLSNEAKDAQAALTWSRPELSNRGLVVLARVHLHLSQFDLVATDASTELRVPVKTLRSIYKRGGQEELRSFLLGYAAMTGMGLHADRIAEHYAGDEALISRTVRDFGVNTALRLAELSRVQTEAEVFTFLGSKTEYNYRFLSARGSHLRKYLKKTETEEGW